jgi:hypothetical protein
MKGTAMTDVEQVARLVAEKYHGKPVSTEYLKAPCTGGAVFMDMARAAMAATRRIDAAVVRDRFNLWHDAEEIADWLEARAKEVCDAD